MNTYTKIDTLYKRYQNLGKNCPNKKWLKFSNCIIKGRFSNPVFEYLYNCKWEGTSKIDGTNSKICYFPSTGEIRVGGKTDKASSQHGQFEMLQEIADRIKPELAKMFPAESAKFIPVKGENNKLVIFDDSQQENVIPDKNGLYYTEFEESPVYIYGEYFGAGIQGCGKRYSDTNHFLVFDIDAQGWWMPRENREEICKQLNLGTVPYIGVGTLSEFEEMVTKGFPTKFEEVKDSTLIEEGIVARPIIPIKDSRGKGIIVKIKNCDYAKWADVRSQFTDEEFEEFNKWYNENIENII